MVMYREQAMDGLMSEPAGHPPVFDDCARNLCCNWRCLMACVGIYGVVSHVVGERTHEIAIRVALGAERWEISRMVLWDGAKMALAASPPALGRSRLTRLMSSMLFASVRMIQPRLPEW